MQITPFEERSHPNPRPRGQRDSARSQLRPAAEVRALWASVRARTRLERAATRDSLLKECQSMRREAAAGHAAICAAAHEFKSLRGPRWCGFSSLRDYCAERLGVPASTFYKWIRQAHLLREAPNVAAAHAEGQLSASALEELAQLASPAEAKALLPAILGLTIRELRQKIQEARRRSVDSIANGKESASAGTQPGQSGFSDPAVGSASSDEEGRDRLVHMRVPSLFAPYVRDTLRLAQALIGTEGDDEMRLAAILAEASTEVELTVPAAEALSRIAPRQLNRTRTVCPSPYLGSSRNSTSDGQSDQSTASMRRAATLSHSVLYSSVQHDLEHSSSEHRDSAQHAQSATSHHRPTTRDRAHFLDLSLRRLLSRRRRLHIRHEDKLLSFKNQSVHHRIGYRRFDDFARAELGLAPSTTFEMLGRAEKRRRDDPIGLAHAQGTITSLKATLLLQLPRIGAARSDLARWIAEASTLTVRALRDRIAWARRQADTDYRAWSLKGCPPPTNQELRTSRHSLRELATHPDPPALLNAAPLHSERRITFSWVLSEDTSAFMAQLLASIQDRVKREAFQNCEPWRALVLLCYQARRAWSALEKPHSRREEAILERDDWRCAVPGCSARRSLQRHHIQFRSLGGGDEAENQVTLCAFHHLIGVHQGLIAIKGRARRGGEDLDFSLGLRPGRRPLAFYRGDREITRGAVHAA
jgi:hypothetical protein